MSDVIKLLRDSYPYEIREEFNTFRTNLLFTGSKNKVIMLTSCTENEGKSTIALHLSVFLAEIGKKVYFIDCDLRKSILPRNFAMPKTWLGLSHFLSGQCEPEQIIYRTNNERLFVTFSGMVPPSSTKLLSDPSFHKFLTAARKTVDYVIVDTPPLGMVTDAAIIAPSCDGAVIVIEAGTNKRTLAKEVVEKLEVTGCPIIGAVLNKANRTKSGYYYGKKYKHYYYQADH